MPNGKLKVLLVSTNGLKSGDSFSKIDPYAILTCESQSYKSGVLRGFQIHEWNETFEFTIFSSAPQLEIKILDEDLFTADDELGTAKIPIEAAFELGKLHVTSYNVLRRSCGQVNLSLTFTPEGSHSNQLPVEAIGGSNRTFYDREQQSGPYGSDDFRSSGAGAAG